MDGNSMAMGFVIAAAFVIAVVGISLIGRDSARSQVLETCQLYGKVRIDGKMLICPEIQPAK